MKKSFLYLIYSIGIISLYKFGEGARKLIPIIIFLMIYYIIAEMLIKKNMDLFNLNKKYIYIIIVFIVLNLVSIVGMKEKNPYGAISYIILLTIILISMTCNEKDFMNFFKFIKYIGDMLILYGIVEFFSGKNIFFQYMNLSSAFYKKQFETNGVVRVSTIFGHPIIYGTILICLFWINYIDKEKHSIFFKRKISMILIVINLILTQSRSCWITFAITIILYYIPSIKIKIKRNKIKKRSIILSICMISIMAIFSEVIINFIYFFIDRFNDIFTSDGKASLLQRTGAVQLILNSLKSSIIYQNLFGHGLFSTVELLLNNTIFIQGFTSIDNQYITMIYEQGIFTMVTYMVIIIFNTYRYFKYTNKYGSIYQKIAYFIFITISINMFFYEAISIKWYSVSILLMISIGALGINKNITSNNKLNEVILKNRNINNK